MSEEYILSDTEVAMLREVEKLANEAIQQTQQPFIAHMQGALDLIRRQQKLEGKWNLNETKDKLIKQESPNGANGMGG